MWDHQTKDRERTTQWSKRSKDKPKLEPVEGPADETVTERKDWSKGGGKKAEKKPSPSVKKAKEKKRAVRYG